MTTERKKDNPKIVIDLGSSTIKCGYNCDSVPRFEIPNVIGKCHNKSMCLFRNYDQYFCGYDALYNGTALDLKYPRIEKNGKFNIEQEEGITDLETLFSYILETKMKVKPDEHDFFIIDSTFTTSKERLAIAKILFEKFSVYHLHFEPQTVMTLLSSAKTSGLVVESGEIGTEIVPVVEGYVITNGITRFPIGGQILTKQFMNEYKNIFDINNVNNHFWMAQKIKEGFSEILPSKENFESLIQKNENKKKYKLPDGNNMDLGNEIYEIPESIFNPSLIGLNNKNLAQTIIDSINNCDISARKPLFNNIILGGGNTLIKGFPERLKSEIELIKAQNSKNINGNKECGLCYYPERKYNAWIGASQISSLSSFSSNWISRVDEYSENEEFIFGQNYVFNYRGLINQKE